VKQKYADIIAKANSENKDGCFTAFIAFEWHSCGWGDYHVIYEGDTGEVCYRNTYQELLEFVKEKKCLAIPHHLAYKPGWRGVNWQTHDYDLCPVCEIYSEHGCSFEFPSHRGMITHSMGGCCKSQTVIEQLKKGKVLGFTGSTDNHFGYPGSYGEGLTGVWSSDLSRKGILDAIRKRHCYAVTGDRIAVNLKLADRMMGDVLSKDIDRDLEVEVQALDEIEYVELNKNGQILKRWQGDDFKEEGSTRMFRLEWGWDALGSDKTTFWKMNGEFNGANIEKAWPCFGGGAGSIEALNTLDIEDGRKIAIESFTSRQNPEPTNSVVFEISGSGELTLDVTGDHSDGPFSTSKTIDLNRLNEKDVWFETFDSFSCPKVHACKAYNKDEEKGDNDFYYVKVLQKNGHMAWSSPIYCR
jgi:hypothetical protein